MNPRQRRGVLLLAIAFLGAIAVFVAVSSYVASVREDVTPKTTVYVLERPVEAQAPVTGAMLRPKAVPQKYVSAEAIRSPAQIGARVAGQRLPAGAELSEGMLVDPPTIEPGQREISVLISADTGVAGKIQPGDLVDINATYPGDQRSVESSRTIIARARIIQIGTPQTATAQRNFAGTDDAPTGAAGGGSGSVVPVSFALSPRGVLVLSHAESFANEIRLSLIPQGDDTVTKKSRRTYVLPATKQRPAR